MAEQGPMAIAMRLRNQLQSVYKLDPLRNEVSGCVVRAPAHRGRNVRGVRLGQSRDKRAHLREIVVLSAALMERARAMLKRAECEHAWTGGGVVWWWW